jgi:hypothetical protein
MREHVKFGLVTITYRKYGSRCGTRYDFLCHCGVTFRCHQMAPVCPSLGRTDQGLPQDQVSPVPNVDGRSIQEVARTHAAAPAFPRSQDVLTNRSTTLTLLTDFDHCSVSFAGTSSMSSSSSSHSGDRKHAAYGDLPKLITHVIPPSNSALTSCNNRAPPRHMRRPPRKIWRRFNSAKKLAIPSPDWPARTISLPGGLAIGPFPWAKGSSGSMALKKAS